jgi:hypothetical protein
MVDETRKARTEQQVKWFAGLRAETGRSLEEWVAIALACPEPTHGKRVRWFKAQYGLGQNLERETDVGVPARLLEYGAKSHKTSSS